eukprot:6179420-Pleurochrysis_carterae.AAC.7
MRERQGLETEASKRKRTRCMHTSYGRRTCCNEVATTLRTTQRHCQTGYESMQGERNQGRSNAVCEQYERSMSVWPWCSIARRTRGRSKSCAGLPPRGKEFLAEALATEECRHTVFEKGTARWTPKGSGAAEMGMAGRLQEKDTPMRTKVDAIKIDRGWQPRDQRVRQGDA